jgi:hypothetical protein
MKLSWRQRNSKPQRNALMKMELDLANLDWHFSSEVSFITYLPVLYKGTATQLLGSDGLLLNCQFLISPCDVNQHYLDA